MSRAVSFNHLVGAGEQDGGTTRPSPQSELLEHHRAASCQPRLESIVLAKTSISGRGERVRHLLHDRCPNRVLNRAGGATYGPNGSPVRRNATYKLPGLIHFGLLTRRPRLPRKGG